MPQGEKWKATGPRSLCHQQISVSADTQLHALRYAVLVAERIEQVCDFATLVDCQLNDYDDLGDKETGAGCAAQLTFEVGELWIGEPMLRAVRRLMAKTVTDREMLGYGEFDARQRAYEDRPKKEQS